MNDEVEADAPAMGVDQSGGATSLLERIAKELWRLNEAEATGELAALRRMDRHSVPPTAFYRVMARAGADEMGAETIRRWAHTVAIMAQRPDSLKASGLGETLKDIGVSEQRLDMLLYARGPALYDLTLRTAKRIANSGESLPYRDLCRLILYDGRLDKANDADNVRIRIAQSYLRATDKQDNGGSRSPAPTT